MYADEHVRLFPEAFEIIKLALFLAKDVDEHVAVIHQHPTAVAFAFDGNGQTVVLVLDGFAHAVGKRLDLAVAVPGADDEKISDDCVLGEVEQNDVLGFLVFNGVNNIVG